MNILYYIKRFLKLYVFNEKIEYTTKNKKAYIMLSANYGNLGDVAITYAQHKFIQNVLPNYEIIEVPQNKVYRMTKFIKKNIGKDDIITIIGGGNTGDRYIEFEEIRRFIIREFKNNKIISFPQTIDFSNTKKGNKEFKRTIKAYNTNKNLYIFAREKKSFEIYKDNLKTKNIYCVPDIVLSLNEVKEDLETREIDVLFSLRNDSEKIVNNDLEEKLIDVIKENYKRTKFRDTHIGEGLKNDNELKIKLNELWDDFRNSKVVITDRLHGMIFCAITATPCIVLPNSNHKIRESYNNWLSDVEYINFLEEIDIKKILHIIEEILKNQNRNKRKNFDIEYKELEKALKN